MNISTLIVDDDETIQKLAADMLTRSGYITQSVSSAEEALKILENFKADIVLTDIELGGMDGLTLTKSIKDKYQAEVIVMTGNSSDYSYEQVINAGASALIFKPFGYKELNLRIKRVANEIHLKSQLHEAYKNGEESSRREKRQFMELISHELISPLNRICGLARVLIDTQLTPEQRHQTELICSGADSLLMVMNEILDYYRIEVNKLTLESIDFDLRLMLDDIVDILSMTAFRKGVEFKCEVSPEVTSYVRGDPGRLRQILINLAGNAIRFTEKGEVSIKVVLEEESDISIRVRLTVSDTGVGIDNDKIANLFHPFRETDISTIRKYGAAGLGLVISKGLVELMDGQIGVESITEEGTTFWFTVELEKQLECSNLQFVVDVDILGQRVLVVDDSQTNRENLMRQLQCWGCSVQNATSGEEALERLRKATIDGQPFNIAIIDMHMPGMDGAELGLTIKRDPALCETFLILLTSMGQYGDTSRAKEIGFSAYLSKPVKSSQFYDVLVTVVGLQSDQAEQRQIITRHSAAEVRKRATRILLAEDNLNKQLATLNILERLGYRADALKSGEELLRAVEKMQYDIILIDIDIPDIFTITDKIRKHNPHYYIPIIVMSGHPMARERSKCFEAGMDDYISKPLDLIRLSNLIERWTRRVEESDLLPDETSESYNTTDKRDCCEFIQESSSENGSRSDKEDISSVTATATLDHDIKNMTSLDKMMERFIKSIPEWVESLERLIERGEWKVLEQQAHSLKEISANFSMADFSSSASLLEQIARVKDPTGANEALGQIIRQLECFETENLNRYNNS